MPLTKPRIRNNKNIDFGISHYYKAYCTRAKNKSNRFKITQGQHAKVLDYFFSLVGNELIYNNYIFKIPALGIKFAVKKNKQVLKYDDKGNIIKSGLPVDWKSTLEYWEKNPKAKEKKTLIYYLNDHTDGYRYGITFRMYQWQLNNIKHYNFKTSTKLKNKLNQHLKNPYRTGDYYEW